jgi:hypothetical protein
MSRVSALLGEIGGQGTEGVAGRGEDEPSLARQIEWLRLSRCAREDAAES